MGYAISWLAVKDKDPESVKKELGLISSGKFGAYAQYPFVGRLLATDWYLVVANRCDHRIVSDRILTTLSTNCVVVASSIEEHVMYSCSTQWSDGKELWRAKHESDRGRMDLRVTGATPEEFNTIREDLFAQQIAEGGEEADVDVVFDIPLQLAKHYVGFKHDEEIPGIEFDRFEILEVDKTAEGTPTKSRWKFW